MSTTTPTTITIDPDGWTTLHCGGAVLCEDGRPVRVSDGVHEGVAADGEVAESTPAEPFDVVDDLDAFGWIVTLGEWDAADGELDCTADVTWVDPRIDAVEAAYDSATGSFSGWTWCHHPGGASLDGPGALDDFRWAVWEAERALALVSQLDDAGDEIDSPRAVTIAAAEREYGERVQASAEAAEDAASAAVQHARKLEWHDALSAAQGAAGHESDYDDDPVWRPLVDAITKAIGSAEKEGQE